MRWGRLGPVSIALAAAATLALPAAAAHAYLDAANPAPNGRVENGTGVLALRFTEVMDPEHTNVTLEGPQGTVEPTELDVPSKRPRVLRVEVDPLEPGDYELVWTTFSIDSHVDRGRLAFSVGASDPSNPIEPQAREPGILDPGLSAAETVGRLLFIVGALVAFGLPIYLSEVDPADKVPDLGRLLVVAAGVLGALGSIVLAAVLVARLDVPAIEALSTLPGLFLVGKTLLMGSVAALAARSPSGLGLRSRGVFLVILPATVALVLHSMSGHGVLATTSKESAAGHLAMTVHLAAGGLWLGGLVGLLVSFQDVPGLVERIRAFTPLALASVLLLAGTGLVQAYVHLPSLAALWTSSFGWALVAKTGLFVLVLGFGAWHGFVLPDRLKGGLSTPGSFSRSGRAEVVVLGGVLLAASVMGVLPVPEEGVKRDPGPRAVFEEAGSLPGYEYRVALVDDPIRAGDSVPVEVQVRSTSSQGLADASLQARLEAGDRSIPIELAPSVPAGPADTARMWRATDVGLPSAGTWILALEMELPTGNHSARIPVDVLPRG